MRYAVLLLLIVNVSFASDPYPKNENIGVSHYVFDLQLNDSTDIITGTASVTIKFKKPVAIFDLNLIGKKPDGKGMEVISVTSSGKPVDYKFSADLISIRPGTAKEATYIITYRGIPADGLIISKNKFGDRTFFGDNWPDRGRNWLPTVDHPAYKATVDFNITAPDHYQVVATGKLVEEKGLGKKQKLTRYKESVPVSVKVMTIGVARFSVRKSGEVTGIPITTWVYPQNKGDGFSDFAIGPDVFEFMQDYIGPYPFEKLAHVQSKTKFGGLENATNIFYFENSVTGRKERDALIAHETAHQWFGNSATEADWHHVWLSEGLATYFSALYMDHAYGGVKFIEIMKQNRERVIEFSKINSAAIVDTTITDINKILSTNTYQKAAWVLHMLESEMETGFKEGIREYYSIFRDSIALTADFINVMQKHTTADLNPFFQRWLYEGGHPHINGTWHYDEVEKVLILDLELTQNSDFRVTIPVLVKGPEWSRFKIALTPGKYTYSVTWPSKPVSLSVDSTIFLFEGQITPK